MQKKLTLSILACACMSTAIAKDTNQQAWDAIVSAQNAALEKNTDGQGFGPQSPRDLGLRKGSNTRTFVAAPAYQQMNLCNIHFHKNAEHKGGQFTSPAEDGHGHGGYNGYKYSGKLLAGESKSLDEEVCKSEHGGLQVGDTIEMHYVHSTAQVVPGPTLNACLSESLSNPQLRVEAQVFVLVNDSKAADFNELAKVGQIKGYHQALNIPKTTGKPVQYAGSTTGPAYNEKGSPLQVSWSVRPRVIKVNADSVGQWCKGNSFNEDHAHGVRNLVVNEKLLSHIR
jgi:opacity protein-like surface antigen